MQDSLDQTNQTESGKYRAIADRYLATRKKAKDLRTYYQQQIDLLRQEMQTSIDGFSKELERLEMQARHESRKS